MKDSGLDYFDDLDDGFAAADDAGSTEAGSRRDRARARAYRTPYAEPGRRPAAERETAFNVLFWLLEGATGAVEELRHNDMGLSEEFWVHAQAVKYEGLMAARALIDQMIDGSALHETQETERARRREQRGSVDIDF